jgi:hypothetical protein
MLTLTLATLALLSPTAPTTSATAPILSATAGGVEWHQGTFFDAKGQAGAARKQILLYFWANGSNNCVAMYQNTMADEKVVSAMGKMVCMSANTGDPAGYKLVQKYNVETLPTILIIDPGGEVEDAILGYIDPGAMADELARIGRGENTITDFRKKAAEKPDDIETQFAYAIKLKDCGDKVNYEKVASVIKGLDPDGDTQAGARFLLEDMQTAVFASVKAEDGSYAFEKADLKPIGKYLTKIKHPEIQFDGWSWVSGIEREAKNNTAMRQALVAAWDVVPEERAPEFGKTVAWAFFDDRESLKKPEAKFALKVAMQIAEQATLKSEQWAMELKAEGGEGCASYEGCAEGDDKGCGGCPGKKGEIAAYRAGYMDALACSYFINGKKKKAHSVLAEALELAPDNEYLNEHLAIFTGKKKK